MDFVEFEIELDRPSNGGTVRRHTLGATYAKPLYTGPGGACSKFIVRFDDPKSWAEVEHSFENLSRARPFRSGPRLHRIEVALDTYDRDNEHDGLSVITEQRFRFATNLCSSNLRLARHQGETVSADFSTATLARRLKEGFTLYVGDKGADASQRFYVKTTDRRRTLPPNECCARMEVTLAGGSLPFASLQDAASFRFETLSCWFRFRKLHTDAATWTPLQRAVASRQVVIGTRGERGRRLYSASTQADTKLNERARNALRDLTRRMTKRDAATVQKSGGRTLAAPL